MVSRLGIKDTAMDQAFLCTSQSYSYHPRTFLLASEKEVIQSYRILKETPRWVFSFFSNLIFIPFQHRKTAIRTVCSRLHEAHPCAFANLKTHLHT